MTRVDEPRRARYARWFLLVGFGYQVVVGYSAAFAYDTALWGWHRQGMARALWGLEEVPEVARPIVAQLMAMLGSTIACWALAMLWVVAGPFRRREPWSWWCILSSLLAWGLVDTALSWRHGVMINVVFNLVAMAMVLGPLALTYRHVVVEGRAAAG